MNPTRLVAPSAVQDIATSYARGQTPSAATGRPGSRANSIPSGPAVVRMVLHMNVCYKARTDPGDMKGLGLKIIPRGAESREVLAILETFGCDVARGYCVGHPIAPESRRRLVDVNQTRRQQMELLMRPPYRRLAITLLLSLLAACAAVQGQERSHKLLETTQTYLSSLRWGHYDLAARMIINRDTKPKEVDFDFLKKIRVTAYKVTDQLSTQDMSAADLTVTISYYHTEYGTIRTLTDHQAWRYDEDVNAWYLDGNLPDFKAGSAAPR